MNTFHWTDDVLGVVRGLLRGRAAPVPASCQSDTDPVILVRAQICQVLDADIYVPSAPLSRAAARRIVRLLNLPVAQGALGTGIREFCAPYQTSEPLISALYVVRPEQWAVFCDTEDLEPSACGGHYACGDDGRFMALSLPMKRMRAR